jgi:hypothetical protein
MAVVNFNEECIKAELAEQQVLNTVDTAASINDEASSAEFTAVADKQRAVSKFPHVDYNREYTEYICNVLQRAQNKPLTMQQLVNGVTKIVNPQMVPKEEYRLIRNKVESHVRKSLKVDKFLFVFTKAVEGGRDVTLFSLNVLRSGFVEKFTSVMPVKFNDTVIDVEITVGFPMVVNKTQSINARYLNKEYFGAMIATLERSFSSKE